MLVLHDIWTPPPRERKRRKKNTDEDEEKKKRGKLIGTGSFTNLGSSSPQKNLQFGFITQRLNHKLEFFSLWNFGENMKGHGGHLRKAK